MMCLSMLSWGMSWTSAKILNEYHTYNNLVYLRFLIGFISICPFLYKRSLGKVKISTIFNIIITSVLFYIYNQCFFIGTDIGNPGMGGVFVTTTNPVITFIIVSLINKKSNFIQICSMFLGIIGGLFTLNVFSLGWGSFLFSGNYYFLFCSLSWGIMTIIMSYGQKDIDSIWYVSLCYLLTTLIALFFIDFKLLINFNYLNVKFIFNFFIVCSAMSFGTSIYIIASYKLGPIQASSFILSVPFIAMTTAYILIDEPLKLNVLIGGLLSIISIYLINLIKRTQIS